MRCSSASSPLTLYMACGHWPKSPGPIVVGSHSLAITRQLHVAFWHNLRKPRTSQPVCPGLCCAFNLAGRYDWSGQLELAPDPFTVWEDAQSLLAVSNSTADGRRRSLLQTHGNTTSTGMVPVQGRVGVRETRAPVQASGTPAPGVLALDDGDITLVCQDGQCPSALTGPGQAQNPLQGVPAAAGGTSSPGGTAAVPGTPLNIKVVVVAALVAPAGLALLGIGVAAAVIRRRRRQKEKAEAVDTARLQKQRSGRPPGLQGPQPQGGLVGARTIWRSTDGSPQWGPQAGPAALRRSTGVHSDFDDSSDGQACPPNGLGTLVEGVRPGETGFGSMPGGFGGPGAILPPARDSAAGFGFELEHTGHAVHGAGGNRWSLAGSLAGMATTVAHALHLR